jgi:hypothetical protein
MFNRSSLTLKAATRAACRRRLPDPPTTLHQPCLAGSQQAADRIRSETSVEQHLQILGVEEFEVLTSELKD